MKLVQVVEVIFVVTAFLFHLCQDVINHFFLMIVLGLKIYFLGIIFFDT